VCLGAIVLVNRFFPKVLLVRQEKGGDVGRRAKGGAAFVVELPLDDIKETLPELEKPPGHEQESFPELSIMTKTFDDNLGGRHVM
jgi:hypothetical protein